MLPDLRQPRRLQARQHRATARAFSLLELLMVIALLGLVAVVAWPDFQAVSHGDRLKESAGRLESLVAMCRAEAMNDGRAYRVEVLKDGSLRVTAQADPIFRPNEYLYVQSPWTQTEVLLDDVWVESVQALPEGPPPIRIVDERLEFPKTEIKMTPVEELESPAVLNFPPDGTTRSMRWLLRQEEGEGVLLTLDGRLGRLNQESVERLAKSDLKRPKPLEKSEREAFDKAAEQAAQDAKSISEGKELKRP